MADFEQYLTPRNLIIGGIAVVAGLFIAPRIFGGKKEQPTTVEVPIEKPYAVGNTEGYSPYQGPPTSPPPVVPVPPDRLMRPPVVPVPPGHPTQPPQPPPSQPSAPRPNPTPTPPGPPQAHPSIPGGYTGTCREVQPPDQAHPHDLSHNGIHNWIKAYGGSGVQGTKRALAMAIWGSTGKPTLRDVADKYLLLGGAYTNAQRVKHGLRPLTQQAFDQLKNDVRGEIIAQRGRTSVSDNFLYYLFDTYHTPYLC